MNVFREWSIILGVFFFTVTSGFLYLQHRSAVEEAYNRGKQDMVVDMQAQYLIEQEKATQLSIKLEKQNEEALRNKDATIRSIQHDRDAAIERLRNERNSRSSAKNTGSDREATSSCTGRELFEEDAEFLIRESARADRVLEERNYWYGRYEKVRQELNTFYGKN